MRQAAADAELTVIAGDPAAVARDHGVHSIGRFDMRALRRELGRAQLLISGGGNLFQDSTSARSCLYYLAIVDQALKAGVPVAVLGQGIGPLRRRWLRALVRRYLNRVQAVAVRDSQSARELERMGVKSTPVRVTADPSLAMTPADSEQVAQAWSSIGVRQDEPVLAVAPRTWRVRALRGEFLARLGSAIRQATRSLHPPAQIVVFPMHRPRDDAACADLADAVGGIAAHDEIPTQTLAGMMGAARAVIGMRLHALIFAAMGGAMPIAVSYDPKVEAFMADLDLTTAATAADLEEDRLASAIADAWHADADARASIRRTMDERRQTVRDMFRWATQLARPR